MNTVQGKIAAILNRNAVVINKGTDDGVEKGDLFWIYSEIGPFVDPDTKEELGVTRRTWGKVVVSTVEKRFCVAETEYQVKNLFQTSGLGQLIGGISEKAKLPVNEAQISDNWPNQIEVGFGAILQKKPVETMEKRSPALTEPLPHRLEITAESAPEEQA